MYHNWYCYFIRWINNTLDITKIDFAAAKREGIKAVVFDKDNCITLPYSMTVYPPVKEGLDECKDIFEYEMIAVVSNSAGSSDDALFEKAEELEKQIGIPVLRHGRKVSTSKILSNWCRNQTAEIKYCHILK